MSDVEERIAALPDKRLLLLDDDAPLRNRLGRALEQRGFECRRTRGNDHHVGCGHCHMGMTE